MSRWIEHKALFKSLLTWFTLATAVGAIVGAATAGFLQGLEAVLGWMRDQPFRWALLPLGMVLSTFLIRRFAPDAKGHGTEKVIEAVHQHSGHIAPRVIPVKLVATLVTLATGGSAGKEGPCAQIGGGLASLMADWIRLDDAARRKLVICGVSAGFATVFGTPVAGALFAVEVLAVGQLQYAVLFPAFVAAVTGFQIAHALGSQYFSKPLAVSYALNEVHLLEVAIAGVVLGLGAFGFIELLKRMEHWGETLPLHPYVKAAMAGGLMLLTLLVSDHALGLGLQEIEGFLSGSLLSTWDDPLLKMLTTTITLSFGGSGGILTPVFFIGASLGSLVAQVLALDPALFATLGFVGFLAACANTPIAASVMAMELFGSEIGVYGAMVSIIAFLITGHRSVYPTQLLWMNKADELDVPLGQPLSAVHPE